MKTIAIVNPKGGSTKSTTTIHLSYNLSGKVLVIDADMFQRNTTGSLLHRLNDAAQQAAAQTIASHNSYSLLTGDSEVSQCIVSVTEACDLIGAFNQGNLNDLPAVKKAKVLQRLPRKLAEVADEYDWVLIDTRGTAELELHVALIAADMVVFPVTPGTWSLETLSGTAEAIAETRELAEKDIQLRVLPARIRHSSQNHQGFLAALREQFAGESILSEILEEPSIQETAEEGRELSPRSKAFKAFAVVAGELEKSA